MFWSNPPLILIQIQIVPPLIWGWRTYCGMAFDALGAHASSDERRQVMKRHRPQLLGMGWRRAILVYALFFAFLSLWFTHFYMDALDRVRKEAETVPAAILKNNLFLQISLTINAAC